jgi:autotransporter-associated beta strand protein
LKNQSVYVDHGAKEKKMRTLKASYTLLIATGLFLTGLLGNAQAATLTATGTGTWDFNNTAYFTSIKWTNNADTARFNGSGNVFVNINNASGQVGAYGLTTFNQNQAGNWYFWNQPLQIGAGGIQNGSWQGGIYFSNDVQVAASQVWAMNNKYRDMPFYGNLSGTANITFDAMNYYGQVILYGSNTVSGSFALLNAGRLLLDYGVMGQNNSKLDTASPLILSNTAQVQWQGGASAYTQAVNGVTIAGAGDFYLNRAGGNNILSAGAINRTGVGSTLRFGNANTVLTSSGNMNGILGGWAATGAGWAYNAAGSGTGAIAENQGTPDNNPLTGWLATENVNHNSTLANPVTSRTINSLRMGGPASLDLSGTTLTLASGGLMVANSNPTLKNGFLQSGLPSGELFVWTLNNNLTNNAVIQDNGATPTVLVKAGNNTLVLTAANTYSGPTYVNQGTLHVNNNGSLGTNAINVGYNATLSFNRTDTYNLANTFTSYGTIQNINTGTVNLSAANSIFGMPALNNTTPGQVLNTAAGTLNLSLSGTNTLGLVQNSGIGTLNLTATGTNTIGALNSAGSSGVVTLSGANSSNTVAAMTVSAGATNVVVDGFWNNSALTLNTGGTMLIGGGTFASLDSLGDNTKCTYIQTNGTASFIGSLGMGGNPVFAYVSGGTLTLVASSGNPRGLGLLASGNAIVNMSGGSNWRVASDGTSHTLSISNNAVVTVANTLQMNSVGTASTGILDLSGGTLSVGGLDMSGNPTNTVVVNFNSGRWLFPSGITLGPYSYASYTVLGGGAVIDTTNKVVTMSQPLLNGTGGSSDGGLIKLGTGTMLLNVTNTFTGMTVVKSGALLLNAGGYSNLVNTAGITVPAGGAIGTNGALSQAFLDDWLVGKVTAGSVVTGAVVMAGNTATPLAFTNNALSGAFLGAGYAAATMSAPAVWPDSLLRLGGGNANLTYSSAIGGGTNLIVGPVDGNPSSGTILNNATYGGTWIQINSGLLQAGTGATYPSLIGVAITNNGIFVWNRNGTFTNTLTMTGTGRYGVTGNGTLLLSQAPDVTGGVYVGTGGTVAFSNAVTPIVNMFSGSGTITINTGTFKQSGSSSCDTLNVTNSAIFDLNGYDVTVANLGIGTATSTITNSATGAGTNTLRITAFTTIPVNTRISDGAERKVALAVANGTSSSRLENNGNTFSGGFTLMTGTGNGTRVQLSTAPVTTGTAGNIVSSPFGCGPIIIGQTATDKAQLFVYNVTATLLNDMVFNSALGSDQLQAIRLHTATLTLGGKMTANLADMSLSANGGIGTANLLGQITGPRGLSLKSVNYTLTTILSNTTANANSYQGNTTVDASCVLTLATSGQIPNGVGAGDVIINGSFNLNSFSEAINGLSGTGTVDSVSGTPSLTVGDGNATGDFGGTLKNTSGTLALTKIGSGVQTLSGTNTYSGATTISNGTLKLAGIGSISNSPLITVAAGSAFDVSTASGSAVVSGQTLKGEGTVIGPAIVAAGGTLEPGGTSGTLNVTGNLTLRGTLAVIGNSARTASTPWLSVTGSIDLTGVTVSGSSLLSMSQPSRYVLLTYTGTRTGTVATVQPAGWQVQYDDAAKRVLLVGPPMGTLIRIL